jgi:hypothetical protein
LNFSSEGDGFSKPAKSSNSKPSKDLLDLDFGNPVAQPPPPQRTGKTETPLTIRYNVIYQNDLFLVISSFSSLLLYEFTEASIVKDSEIDSQDRYENTTLSSDFDKEGFSDAFSDFDKELKQEIDAIKKGLDVTELGTSSFSMLLASLARVLFLKVQVFKKTTKV